LKAIFFPFRSAIVRIGESFETRIPSASGVGDSYAVLQNPSPEVQVTGSSRAGAKVVLGAWVNSADYGSVNRSIQEKVLKDVA
jgi:hypothetical protein